jgi:DNA-binding transcriptional ArsR family regulator
MGLTKTQHFSSRQNRTAAIARALGHPARIAILEYLARRQICVCGDLVGELPLAQATVSQHLKELKSVGLIKGETEGTSVCYCLNEPVWEEAREVLLQLFHLPLTDKSC